MVQEDVKAPQAMFSDCAMDVKMCLHLFQRWNIKKLLLKSVCMISFLERIQVKLLAAPLLDFFL